MLLDFLSAFVNFLLLNLLNSVASVRRVKYHLIKEAQNQKGHSVQHCICFFVVSCIKIIVKKFNKYQKIWSDKITYNFEILLKAQKYWQKIRFYSKYIEVKIVMHMFPSLFTNNKILVMF